MARRENLDNIAGFILAGVLWMTSLYQIEIVERNAADGLSTFDMPFYILSPMNIWVARDVWFLVNAVAFTLVAASALTYGGWRERRRHREN